MVAHAVKVGVDRKALVIPSLLVVVNDVLFNFAQADSAHAADGVGKIFFDNVLRDSNRLKNLRGLVGLHGADSHFGGDFYDAVYQSLVVVVNRGVVIFVQKLLVNQLGDRFVRKVGVHRARSVAQAHRRLVNVADFGAFQND